jgi:hypothetical protein
VLKQGIKAKTSTDIEFSGFNRVQSISSVQLRVFTQNSIRKQSKNWNLNQILKERRKKDAKLKEKNWKFNYDYIIISFKCDYTNYTENQALKLRIHSIVSSKLTLDDQFEI